MGSSSPKPSTSSTLPEGSPNHARMKKDDIGKKQPSVVYRFKSKPRQRPQKRRPLKFHCSLCEYHTDRLPNLRRHKACHETKSTFSCPICSSYSSKRQKDMLYHLKRHHSGKERDEAVSNIEQSFDRSQEWYYAPNGTRTKYKFCDKCSYKSANRETLIKHIESEHPDSTQNVPQLRFKSKRQRPLPNGVSVKTEPRDETFQCTDCDYGSNRKRDFELHEICHQKKSTHQCPICNYSVDSPGPLGRHLRQDHRNNEIDVTYDGQTSIDQSESEDDEMEVEEHSDDEENDNSSSSQDNSIGYETVLEDKQVNGDSHLSREIWYHRPNGKRSRYCFCGDCNFKSLTRAQLIKHVKKNHPSSTTAIPLKSGLFHCDRCDFKTWSGSNQHRLCHQKKSPHQCHLCDYSVTTLSSLRRHIKNHHKREDQQDGQVSIKIEKVPGKSTEYFNCPECSFSSINAFNIERHKKCHERNAKFKCIKCTYSNDTRHATLGHMRTNHQNLATDNSVENKRMSLRRSNIAPLEDTVDVQPENAEEEKNKLHQCEFCEFSSNYSRNMRLHEECHRRNEEFKCSLCNFSSHAKFTVDSHLKRDHRSAPLSETIHILKSETKISQIPLHECGKCEYTTTNLRNLENHQIGHQRNQKFKCPRCSFSSQFHHTILLHLKRYHQKEGGTTNSELNTIQISAAKTNQLYECPLCDFSSKHDSNVKAHELAHKQKEKFQCRICSYSSQFQWAVTRHLKLHHRKDKSLAPLKMTRPQRSCLQSTKINYDTSSESDSENAIEISSNCSVSSINKARVYCSICDFSTDHPERMKLHQNAHSERGKFKCGRCSFSSDWKGITTRHSRYHHRNGDQSLVESSARQPRTRPANFNMKDDIDSESSISDHLIDEDEDAESASWTSSSSINRDHKLLYDCPICDFSTDDHRQIDKHEKGHKMNGHYKCHQCSYSSHHKNVTTRHSRNHHHQNDQHMEDSNTGAMQLRARATPPQMEGLRRSPRKSTTSRQISLRECSVVLVDIYDSSDQPSTSFSKDALPELTNMNQSIEPTTLQKLKAEEAKCRQQIGQIEDDIHMDHLKMETLQKKVERKTKEEKHIHLLRIRIGAMKEKVHKADRELKTVSSKMNDVKKRIAQIATRKALVEINLRTRQCEALEMSLMALDSEDIDTEQIELTSSEQIKALEDELKGMDDVLLVLQEEEESFTEDLETAEGSYLGALQVLEALESELEELEYNMKGALQENFKERMDQLTKVSQERTRTYLQLENRLLKIMNLKEKAQKLYYQGTKWMDTSRTSSSGNPSMLAILPP